MAMQSTALTEGEPVSEINTTPLIDVMLVLLIMLIVTLPPQSHAIRMDTPVPQEDQVPPPPITEPVRILIDFDGTVFWNGDKVSDTELDRRLKLEAARYPQPEIHVEPHRLAAYARVAHVMATAQRDGLTKIGVLGGT